MDRMNFAAFKFAFIDCLGVFKQQIYHFSEGTFTYLVWNIQANSAQWSYEKYILVSYMYMHIHMFTSINMLNSFLLFLAYYAWKTKFVTYVSQMCFKIMPAATFWSADLYFLKGNDNNQSYIFIHFLKTEILWKSIPLNFRSHVHPFIIRDFKLATYSLFTSPKVTTNRIKALNLSIWIQGPCLHV